MQSTPGSPRAMFLSSSEIRSTPGSQRATVQPSSALRSTPTTPRRMAGRSLTDASSSDEEERPMPRRRCGTVGELDVGYLNKKDVFYTGTITNVAEFQKHPDKYRSTGSLRMRTVSVASADSVDRSQEVREAIQQVSGDTTEDDYGFGLFYANNKTSLATTLVDQLTSLLCGTLTIFCYLCNGFISLSIYAGLFGFSISAYVCLTSVVLVDLLGLGKLTNAFGLLLLWQISGLMLFCIPCIQKKKPEDDFSQEHSKQMKQKGSKQ
ncbi:hypothetical protein ANCCEY_13905 [Ancylostoma ceylanicum]|uniref:Uncharacterized protein n=1 Tax=Ancylostoma ceylanicum TaxID=53326 RepID=A0A0D6L6H2_9BILA|nr:hypothetical protein ANCCEY_13905 [Ancylostoma ceylanicum]